MKKILFIIAILLAMPSWAQEWQEARITVGTVGGGGTLAPGGTEYFGQTGESGVTWVAVAVGSDRWRQNGAIEYVCPGVGDKTVVEISGYLKAAALGTGNVRFGIYTWIYGRVCQGTAEVTVSSTDAGWVGHVGAVNIDPNPCTLTGGTSYRIFFTADSADVQYAYTVGTSGDTTYGATDYTGGCPASSWAGTNSTRLNRVRIGVQ